VHAVDNSIITAMAGVLGSLVGGSVTVATTWVTQRTLSKRELLRTEIRRRENLYGEFISECSKRVIDSFERTLDNPENLLSMYELLNRIRLCASDKILHEAERVLKLITEQYFSSNLSLEEVRALVQKGGNEDPLRSFAEACRFELKSMRGAV
jgi:hypothetical protein